MSDNNQEVKDLRRQVEILRAQLKKSKSPVPKKEKSTVQENQTKKEGYAISGEEDDSFSYVQEDLKKAILITVLILTIISSLAITQSYWFPITEKLIS
ncbi:MAG: hypothetical protein U9M98_00845 [Patescibacteria group bacterium]|nr:hypothetical protein [Patescibacteria group bacterium]